MGNHDVGRAMSAAARGFWAGNGDAEVSKDKALAVLDAATQDFLGSDAEFDDALNLDQPLGRLVAIAFGPWTEEDAKSDPDGSSFYVNIESPFRKRYKFW
jgi:hypothetical protein